MLAGCIQISEKQNLNDKEEMNTTLNLTQEWDKTFPKSDKVEHRKVTFRNRYGIELAADMYTPKVASCEAEKNGFPGIAVSGPFGAVKE
ncbi:MAG: alpha/beta hydrolase, partial [Bacteroidaceae bacterium]|nr:alpha/beta hydrolase [Bacteroidaceae bacterium]